MRRTMLAGLLVTALIAVGCVPPRPGPPSSPGPPGPPTPPGAGMVLAGAADRSVLPTVDGSMDWLDADALPGPDDVDSPGIFVPEWDQGRVAVGNGDSVSHWVRDDLKVQAVALSDMAGERITVVVAANLYMIFRPDADAIRERARAALPAELADRVDIVITSDHNHHGPDTAFDVNHEWYDLMIDRAAEAIVEAVDQRRPSRLRVGEGEHFLGLGDSRDPRIMDPGLGVLQAVRTNGDVVATMVFWANHPEVTLGWTPTADVTDDCAQIGLDPCHARNRYFTADFPGVMTRVVEERVGGVAMFFNGPIGGLVTPLRAAVWEVTDEHPLGNGLVPPPGAEAAGGGTDYDNRNFRRTWVIGEQLALAALDAVEHGQWVADPTISYEETDVFTRLSHFGFRLLGAVDPETGRAAIGHTPGMLYVCPATGPKNDDTCEPDEFETDEDPLLASFGEPSTFRIGDHVRTVVSYLRIGPVGVMLLPGEVVPELVVGLPAGYQDDPTPWHADDLSLHASGADYATPGFVKHRMGDEYRWMVGLGNDQLGYVVPISDYRVFCIADVVEPGTCAALHDAGLIEFPDAIAGTTCKAVTEDPSLLDGHPGDAAFAISASCRYGQAFGQAQSHYEETNSAGWDLADDLLDAVADLTGNDDPTMENPDFPGWWRGLTP